MGKQKLTKEQYTEYLDEIGKSLRKDNFIMDGVLRIAYYPNCYGKALRRFDSIAFEVGYNEWKRNNTKSGTL